jgi:hypothetical protein
MSTFFWLNSTRELIQNLAIFFIKTYNRNSGAIKEDFKGEIEANSLNLAMVNQNV